MKTLAGLALLCLTGCMHSVHTKTVPLALIEAVDDANYLASVMKAMPSYLADKNAAFEQPEINQVLLDLKAINSSGGNLHEQIEKLLQDNWQLICLDKHLKTHQVL